MTKIIKYGKFSGFGVNENKRQIILIHSGRPSNEYLTSLKYRLNGEYEKIPNYFIDKEGKILESLSPEKYSKNFNNKNIDSK